jgi:hypothetical protein
VDQDERVAAIGGVAEARGGVVAGESLKRRSSVPNLTVRD